MNRTKQVETFFEHALPGMTLSKLPPLVHRCPCGKQISDTRTFCLACRDQAIERIAAGHTSEAEIRAVLAQSSGEERAEIARAFTAAYAQRQAEKTIVAEGAD